ncbi:hypothetical protein DOY81_013504 [Sarcophaga bullata]|nr:hypothetical protein DOY81_013504 [Sarcophaga bullata]
MSPIHLNKLDKMALRQWLNSFDVILADCDAVLWHDNEPIPQVPETINALQSLGKQIY